MTAEQILETLLEQDVEFNADETEWSFLKGTFTGKISPLVQTHPELGYTAYYGGSSYVHPSVSHETKEGAVRGLMEKILIEIENSEVHGIAAIYENFFS